MKLISTLWRRTYDLLLVVALGGIGWAAYTAYQDIQMTGGLWRTFTPPPPTEHFVIANHLQPEVEQLTGALVRYVIRGEPTDWEKFQRQSQQLKEWIALQKSLFAGAKVVQVQPVLLTTDLTTLLFEIERVFNDYLTAAQQVAKAAGPEQKLARLEQVQVSARRLADLGSQARAEGLTIQLFLTGSKPWFPKFRHLMTVSLLVMISLLVWLMMVAYRRVVSPLRSKLIDSDQLVERQNKMVAFGKHAADVAHEIRNPLTTIKARLFTLQKRLVPGSLERRDAVDIENEINHVDQIVTDFLTLARPAQPNLVPLSAATVLRDLSDLFRPECDEHSIELQVEATGDTAFLADTRQLKQVLMNLIRNAIESIGTNGLITLRARPDTYRLKNQSTKVVILEVQDTGPGIPTEVQQRLFDPFFTTKERGTGLGLSIAAAIVDQHGGKLVVRSQPGHGATFGIVLPCHS
jgi:signal transduction histidine kinase